MTVVKIQNLSKKYIITQKYSLAERINSILTIFRRNNIQRKNITQQEALWVLKNISLDVKQGDIIAIIGKNGSGKSTILKILSRVTLPTTGTITIYGRVASLLEVGTGFHPELTGRENIFLNASILGMTRKETIENFNAIVQFADINMKLLDTPVKRYSSGMETRLAFSVATHLYRDILILDEVLAVGDTFFQEKAFKKIQSLAKEGKTIIIVNHNHNKIKDLCNRAILIDKGHIIKDGTPSSIIELYLKNTKGKE